MPAPSRPVIWLTGDTTHPCLVPVADWLRAVSEAQVVDAHTAQIKEGRFPAAIVVFQPRPGQVPADRIACLRDLAPFAQVVWLQGPWCEGMSCQEFDGEEAARVDWRDWPVRLAHELGLTTFVARPMSLAGTVAILTDSREACLALEDACAAAGMKASWDCRQGDQDCLLIDGWDSYPANLRASGSPAILLLDWPRPEDFDRAARLGISRLLAKPVRLADLFYTLHSFTGARAPSVSRAA